MRVGQPLVERVVASSALALPVLRGQRVGEVRVFAGGRLIARTPLVAAESVSAVGTPGKVEWYARRTVHHLVRARLVASIVSEGVSAVIVTVTLNAALDRSLTVPIFKLGHRHRASSVLALAGGKGINVARALKRLDVPVVATGLAGGRTGTRIVEELTEEAILNDFVRIRDESRTSTAVVDPTAGTYTEINEWGPKVSQDELEILLDKLRYLSRGASTRGVRGLAAARRRRGVLRRRGPRDDAARRARRPRRRGRAAAHGASRRSRGSSRRTSTRPSSSSARSSRTTTTS